MCVIQPEPEFTPILSANYSGKKFAQVFLFVEFWLTIFIILLLNKWYYVEFMFVGSRWKLLLIPISIYSLVWQFFLITALFSTLIYKILVQLEPPKEGEFPIGGREFHAYCLRFWVSYYLLFVARAMPLPWVDMYVFPIFGAKIGRNVVLYDSWIDPEFVEVGDSCMLSLNTQIFSHAMYRDKFIVQKVVIEKNAIAGANAIIAPGTIIEEGAILGAGSSTKIGQRLRAYSIHVGNPVNITFPIKLKEKEKKKDSPVSENKTGGTLP